MRAQVLVCRPTAPIGESCALSTEEPISDVHEVRQELGSVLGAQLVHALPGGAELGVPCSQELLVAARSKDGIALLERALIATPHAEELVFHVKHTPVEQPAAARGSFLDEAMNARVDHLDGKNLCNLRDPGDPLAGEIRARALPAVLNTGDQLAATGPDPTNDPKEIGSRGQQLLALVRSERPPVREEVDRLEQARLTRAVLSDDSRCLRIELEMRSANAAEILDIDRGQHIARRLDQSRIGMTTYFACGVELALTRQLLLASVRPSST